MQIWHNYWVHSTMTTHSVQGSAPPLDLIYYFTIFVPLAPVLQVLQALGYPADLDVDLDSLSADERSDGEGRNHRSDRNDRMSTSSSRNSVTSSTDAHEVTTQQSHSQHNTTVTRTLANHTTITLTTWCYHTTVTLTWKPIINLSLWLPTLFAIVVKLVCIYNGYVLCDSPTEPHLLQF